MPEVLDRYAADSGRDLSDLGFYIALASFKAAVILEGIHFRYVHGQTVGEGFQEIGTLVEPLVASGLAAMREEEQLMDFGFDERTEELRAALLDFMDAHVYPAEAAFREQLAALDEPLGLDAPCPCWPNCAPRPGRAGCGTCSCRRARRRADQPAVRAARGDHRPQPAAGARPR